MRVKICGLTRSEDVSMCERSGANLIGFINIERSKRNVDIKGIKELISSLKDIERAILVLEPENPEEVVEKVKKTGIRNIQLHSLTNKEIKYLRWIESFHRNVHEGNIKIIRAVGLSEESIEYGNRREIRFSPNKKLEIEGFAKTCDGLLFDYQIDGKSGGIGRQIPLEMALNAVKIAKNANHNIEIFLAGGLNSETIQNRKILLEKVIDYVDVNSGVEDAPGIKNPDSVDELLKISV
jgi:phosphoribosylanthranilate isomerase